MQHFKIHELVDRQTFEEYGEAAWNFFNPRFLQALDDLIDFFSDFYGDYCPAVVNNWHGGGSHEWRGLRTMAQAAALGAPHSEHRYDPDPSNPHLVDASDITLAYYSAQEARNIILAHQDHALLQNIMRLEDGVAWVHMDLKPVTNRIYLFKA